VFNSINFPNDSRLSCSSTEVKVLNKIFYNPKSMISMFH
jgi:hypothetical protein